MRRARAQVRVRPGTRARSVEFYLWHPGPRMKFALATLAVALVLPASALAAGPTMVVRDVPLHTSRSLAASTPSFDMVGLHWRGAGTVSYRARLASGRWTTWRRAA